MDILRALSSPNVDICRKTLCVAMDLVSPRNIEEVVQVKPAFIYLCRPLLVDLQACHSACSLVIRWAYFNWTA